MSAYYTRLTDPLIGTQIVTSERGSSTTLIFAWTPPAYGRYEIRAEASAVPNEVDTADNSRTIIVYIGYGESGIEEHKGEYLNNYHVAIFFSALFFPITMLALRRNKEISMLDVPATLFKENLCKEPHSLDPWQNWIQDNVRIRLV